VNKQQEMRVDHSYRFLSNLVRGNCRVWNSIVRNSVDTRHGLSTCHAGVMKNSRGKSRRRRTREFSACKISEGGESGEGKGMDNELRESAPRERDAPNSA